MLSGSWSQRRRFSAVFSAAPEAIVLAAHQVGEVRPEPSRRDGVVDRMAVDARRGLEDAAAGGRLLVTDRRLPLGERPGVEVFGAVDDTREKHLAVLRSAVLRALTEEEPRPVGSIQVWFTRLGMRSVFPPSSGIQKLWSVSAESSFRYVGRGARSR